MTGIIITLIAFGVLMLVIEFIVPGGIIGIAGVVMMGVAVVLSFNHYGAGTGLMVALATAAVCVLALALWMKYFHRTRLGKALSHEGAVGGTDSFEGKSKLVGLKGVAKTDLHPSGTAIIDGKRVDVVSETKFVAQGAAIEVIQADGFRVVVREIKAP